MRLCDLKKGERAEILSVNLPSPLRERLLVMGLTPGSVISFYGKAPFGSPLIFRLRGYAVSLRKENVSEIEVKLL